MDGSESDEELKELRAGLVARRGASGLTVVCDCCQSTVDDRVEQVTLAHEAKE